MLDYKTKLSNDIAHIFTKEFCEEIVKSPDLNEVCDGDCDYCKIKHIMELIELKRSDLKRNAVSCDHNICYKLDKVSFGKILESMK
jgi:hypothetical protein